MSGETQNRSMQDSKVAPTLLQMVEDHHQALYRYAFRLSGQVSDAEDLTQHVFLVAQQKLDQLKDHSNPRPWLYRILRNQFLKERQKKKPAPEADFENDLVEDLACEVEVISIDHERLQNSLNQLPVDYRSVLMMFYFQELSYKQIASELGTPLGTVMSRIARAKAALRNKLAGDGANVTRTN